MASKVRIEYTGFLDDGTQFDQNAPGEFLELFAGRRTVMKPLMDAAFSMKVGEERTVAVPFEQAYGPYDEKANLVVARSLIENGQALEKGQSIVWHSRKKPQPVAVKVIDCDEHSVKLDFNHPLAGKNLSYRIKVIDAVE